MIRTDATLPMTNFPDKGACSRSIPHGEIIKDYVVLFFLVLGSLTLLSPLQFRPGVQVPQLWGIFKFSAWRRGGGVGGVKREGGRKGRGKGKDERNEIFQQLDKKGKGKISPPLRTMMARKKERREGRRDKPQS